MITSRLAKKLFPIRVFIIGALTLLLSGSAWSAPDSGVDGSGAFKTGHYRNLFVENGRSEKQVHDKIETTFKQLFHGDTVSQAVFFNGGTNQNGALAYISDIKSKDARSEGISYGMMIAVQLNHKPEFDALWNWAKTYMYHASPTHPSFGFFSWSMNTTNNVANDEMPAPDGEEYFATSLYFAAARWGNGTGIYNYSAEADQLLANMRHREPITGPTVTGAKTVGNIFDAREKMVRFTPDLANAAHTDPSYHLPAFYEVWARLAPATERAFWAEAAAVSRDFFERAANTTTGLAPDYANFDGTPWRSSFNTNSADFQYDSWRTAMNWSVDWAWWGKDPREQQRSDRIQSFFESKGITNYGNRFHLDGTQFGKDHSSGLVAMNAVASLAATNPRQKAFLDALWNMPVPTGEYRYYDGMLIMLALLHCSGEFRIWLPK